MEVGWVLVYSELMSNVDTDTYREIHNRHILFVLKSFLRQCTIAVTSPQSTEPNVATVTKLRSNNALGQHKKMYSGVAWCGNPQWLCDNVFID